eukprot:4185415-Amphidinium_carterae.1
MLGEETGNAFRALPTLEAQAAFISCFREELGGELLKRLQIVQSKTAKPHLSATTTCKALPTPKMGKQHSSWEPQNPPQKYKTPKRGETKCSE